MMLGVGSDSIDHDDNTDEYALWHANQDLPDLAHSRQTAFF
jgi:hypothetical protein